MVNMRGGLRPANNRHINYHLIKAKILSSGRLDKSNSHLFSKPLLSKDRLSDVNPCHNYQMLSKADAI